MGAGLKVSLNETSVQQTLTDNQNGKQLAFADGSLLFVSV